MVDIDLNEGSIDSLMRKYLRYKFMGDLGEAALGKVTHDPTEDKLRQQDEMLSIAMKKKALGMAYDSEDLDDALNERKPLVPAGLERQGLIAALGSISKISPASSQSQRQASEIFGKLPSNNLIQLGIKPLAKEAKNAYPIRRAASILSIFGI